MNPYNNPFRTGRGWNSEQTGPIEYIALDSPLRQWILSLLAYSGFDVGLYAAHELDLKLKDSGRGNLKGDCPWCSGQSSFTLSKKTLFAGCLRCGKKDDLLGLTCESKYFNDMYRTLQRLREFMPTPPLGQEAGRQKPAGLTKGGVACR